MFREHATRKSSNLVTRILQIRAPFCERGWRSGFEHDPADHAAGKRFLRRACLLEHSSSARQLSRGVLVRPETGRVVRARVRGAEKTGPAIKAIGFLDHQGIEI